MSSALDLKWDGGGEGRIVSLQGEAIVLRSTTPHAPGSRPTAVLSGGSSIRVKAHRSKRNESLEDGKIFTIEGRVLDLTRDLRATIDAALTVKVSADQS
ncbi:MAG: hypothetical protein HOV80_25905 [Polyangiaceae bacterium]|nr:hypothetical protein [Polyangiaceae bacterium]